MRKIKKIFYRKLSLPVFVLLMLPLSLYAKEREEVKAIYLGRLSNYTTWPNSASLENINSFKICVIGDNPFKHYLSNYRDKQIKKKSVEIKYIKTTKESSDCHLLFISLSERKRVDQILKDIQKSPILTISEIRGFTERNGMIQFYMRGQKVKIKVNLDVLNHYGFSIHSDLLAIVKVVRGMTQ